MKKRRRDVVLIAGPRARIGKDLQMGKRLCRAFVEYSPKAFNALKGVLIDMEWLALAKKL